MKKTLILSTVMFSLLSSPIISANNVKQDINLINGYSIKENNKNNFIKINNKSINVNDVFNNLQKNKLNDNEYILDNENYFINIIFNNKNDVNKLENNLDYFLPDDKEISKFINSKAELIKIKFKNNNSILSFNPQNGKIYFNTLHGKDFLRTIKYLNKHGIQLNLN